MSINSTSSYTYGNSKLPVFFPDAYRWSIPSRDAGSDSGNHPESQCLLIPPVMAENESDDLRNTVSVAVCLKDDLAITTLPSSLIAARGRRPGERTTGLWRGCRHFPKSWMLPLQAARAGRTQSTIPGRAVCSHRPHD